MAKKRNKEPPQRWECVNEHEHFTRFFDSLIHSPAYRVLAPVSAKILLVFKSEYKGNYTGNNIICPYAHIAEKFPDLSRGIPRSITKRKHIPTEFYKNADNLMSHYNEITNAINDIGMFKNAEKREAAIALLGKYAPEMAQMKNQLKMVDDHVTRLEDAVSGLKQSNNRKDDVIYDQSEEINQLKGQLQELLYKQRMLQNRISKIPPEVLEQMKKDEKARRKAEREAR